MTTVLQKSTFDFAYWEKLLPNLILHYSTADPFPNIVLDNFLNPEILEEARKEFPSLDSKEWINYQHVNEDKYGKNKFESFPPKIKSIFEELNSTRFVTFLSKLTNIDNLIPDWDLEGGGLHQSKRGGYLNIHTDFTVHPHKYKWKRQVNLLLYLNKDWQDSYGGHLELWDKGVKKCTKKTSPIFNRAVIFNTDKDSYHGHPQPMMCPHNITRKSFALYYFTEEKSKVKVISTTYKSLPTDSLLKKFMINTDNVTLRIYDRLKRIFNFNDAFASKVLGFLSKAKKR